MILEGICYLAFLVAQGIISGLPNVNSSSNSSFITDTISLISKALQFFPADVWAFAVGSFIFWIGLHLIVGLVKFILGFIPTMDGG